jgi:transcription elongation factor GreA
MQEVYLTRAGADKLRKELDYLKTTRRRELSKEIGAAREHGDLRENAEYDAAKEAQALNETRIGELERKLSNVHIIEDMDLPDDRAYIGATVTVRDLDTDEESEYTLLSVEEADPDRNIISYTSPIGKGLLGHEIGDQVEIETPKRVFVFDVVDIRRDI